jgi:hypothetical protein
MTGIILKFTGSTPPVNAKTILAYPDVKRM